MSLCMLGQEKEASGPDMSRFEGVLNSHTGSSGLGITQEMNRETLQTTARSSFVRAITTGCPFGMGGHKQHARSRNTSLESEDKLLNETVSTMHWAAMP